MGHRGDPEAARISPYPSPFPQQDLGHPQPAPHHAGIRGQFPLGTEPHGNPLPPHRAARPPRGGYGDDNGDGDNGDRGGSRYRLRRSPASHLRHPRAGRVPPGRGPAAAACQGRHFVSRRRRRGEFGERRSPSTAPPHKPRAPPFLPFSPRFSNLGEKIPFSATLKSLSASPAPIFGIPPALPSSRLRFGGKRR